jgi:hypothetical protein
MELFIIITMLVGLFISGVSLGAYLENKRIYSVRLVAEINENLKETKEILIPLGNKIEHIDMRQRDFINHTLVDYNNIQDPEITLEIPQVEEDQWPRKQRSSED